MIKEKVLRKRICKDKQEKILNISIRVVLLFFFCLFVVGCNRTSLSKNDFVSKMERKRYSVTDISNDEFSIVLAVSNHYQIYYYAFKNEVEANKVMEKEVKKLKSDTSKIVKDSGKNYDKYEISNKNIYSVFSRIDNTYIFISALSSYKKEVHNTLSYMGY